MVWLEARDAQALRERLEANAEASVQTNGKQDAVAGTESEEVGFDPCLMIPDYPPRDQVLQFAEMPAFVLTGWRLVGPASWSLSGLLRVNSCKPPTASSMAAQRRVDSGFCLLIIVQWFMVADFH